MLRECGGAIRSTRNVVLRCGFYRWCECQERFFVKRLTEVACECVPCYTMLVVNVSKSCVCVCIGKVWSEGGMLNRGVLSTAEVPS